MAPFIFTHIIVASFLICFWCIPAALAQCSLSSPCGDANQCCSQSGTCGNAFEHCGYGCVAGPCLYHADDPPADDNGPPLSAGRWVTSDLWEQFFPHRDDERCPAAFFYEHEHFIEAAEYYPDFGTTGDDQQQKREIAAFLAHCAHETRIRTLPIPDGPTAWGLCVNEEYPCSQYCRDYQDTECAEGHNYCGRGPLQLRWNDRYRAAGEELGFDGVNTPEVVAQDRSLSWRTALWYWMSPQPPRPIFHDIWTGKWQPSGGDYEANRLPGFGLTINIRNGLAECGHSRDAGANERIQFYMQFCQILGVDTGDNLDCEQQRPYT